MNEIMRRRRALIGPSDQQIVDTSATSTAFYIRKTSAEQNIVYANPIEQVKIWNDQFTGYSDFATSSYNRVSVKQYNDPWIKTNNRFKFGGSNTDPATSISTVDLNYAHAYWQETGRIIFAGIHSPYYGLSNIDGTKALPGWSG